MCASLPDRNRDVALPTLLCSDDARLLRSMLAITVANHRLERSTSCQRLQGESFVFKAMFHSFAKSLLISGTSGSVSH